MGWRFWRRSPAGDSREAVERSGESKVPEDEKKMSKWHRRFMRQELWGWSPILRARNVILLYLAAAIVCVAAGIPMLVSSVRIVKVNIRYDNAGPFEGLDKHAAQALLLSYGGEGVTYSVSHTLDKTIKAPVRKGTKREERGGGGRGEGAGGRGGEGEDGGEERGEEGGGRGEGRGGRGEGGEEGRRRERRKGREPGRGEKGENGRE